MGKAKMLGQFNPRPTGKDSRKAPWQGAKKKPKKEDNPIKLIFLDEFETDPARNKKGCAGYAAK